MAFSKIDLYTNGTRSSVISQDAFILGKIFDYNDLFFVAGGRALSAFDNITTYKQDIDLWFFSEAAFIRAHNNARIFCKKNYPDTKIMDSKNATTFIIRDNKNNCLISIQLIKKIHDNHEEVLSYFDMTNVQVGYIFEKSDVSPLYYTKEFTSSYVRKEIDLRKVHPRTMLRINKLLSKGYTLSSGSIEMLKPYPSNYFVSDVDIDPDATYEDV